MLILFIRAALQLSNFNDVKEVVFHKDSVNVTYMNEHKEDYREVNYEQEKTLVFYSKKQINNIIFRISPSIDSININSMNIHVNIDGGSVEFDQSWNRRDVSIANKEINLFLGRNVNNTVSLANFAEGCGRLVNFRFKGGLPGYYCLYPKDEDPSECNGTYNLIPFEDDKVINYAFEENDNGNSRSTSIVYLGYPIINTSCLTNLYVTFFALDGGNVTLFYSSDVFTEGLYFESCSVSISSSNESVVVHTEQLILSNSYITYDESLNVSLAVTELLDCDSSTYNELSSLLLSVDNGEYDCSTRHIKIRNLESNVVYDLYGILLQNTSESVTVRFDMYSNLTLFTDQDSISLSFGANRGAVVNRSFNLVPKENSIVEFDDTWCDCDPHFTSFFRSGVIKTAKNGIFTVKAVFKLPLDFFEFVNIDSEVDTSSALCLYHTSESLCSGFDNIECYENDSTLISVDNYRFIRVAESHQTEYQPALDLTGSSSITIIPNTHIGYCTLKISESGSNLTLINMEVTFTSDSDGLNHLAELNLMDSSHINSNGEIYADSVYINSHSLKALESINPKDLRIFDYNHIVEIYHGSKYIKVVWIYNSEVGSATIYDTTTTTVEVYTLLKNDDSIIRMKFEDEAYFLPSIINSHIGSLKLYFNDTSAVKTDQEMTIVSETIVIYSETVKIPDFLNLEGEYEIVELKGGKYCICREIEDKDEYYCPPTHKILNFSYNMSQLESNDGELDIIIYGSETSNQLSLPVALFEENVVKLIAREDCSSTQNVIVDSSKDEYEILALYLSNINFTFQSSNVNVSTKLILSEGSLLSGGSQYSVNEIELSMSSLSSLDSIVCSNRITLDVENTYSLVQFFNSSLRFEKSDGSGDSLNLTRSDDVIVNIYATSVKFTSNYSSMSVRPQFVFKDKGVDPVLELDDSWEQTVGENEFNLSTDPRTTQLTIEYISSTSLSHFGFDTSKTHLLRITKSGFYCLYPTDAIIDKDSCPSTYSFKPFSEYIYLSSITLAKSDNESLYLYIMESDGDSPPSLQVSGFENTVIKIFGSEIQYIDFEFDNSSSHLHYLILENIELTLSNSNDIESLALTMDTVDLTRSVINPTVKTTLALNNLLKLDSLGSFKSVCENFNITKVASVEVDANITSVSAVNSYLLFDSGEDTINTSSRFNLTINPVNTNTVTLYADNATYLPSFHSKSNFTLVFDNSVYNITNVKNEPYISVSEDSILYLENSNFSDPPSVYTIESSTNIVYNFAAPTSSSTSSGVDPTTTGSSVSSKVVPAPFIACLFASVVSIVSVFTFVVFRALREYKLASLKLQSTPLIDTREEM